MKEEIISVKSLSKTYKLYHSHRDRLKELLHPLRKKYHHKYHALKNIDFTVHRGEILGIIGQNGSGKSTLLKILCSVVTPTSGTFSMKGKISSILELGGGFNPELTGIQNIYFLGGLQGYTKKEMDKRMKDIVDFADIGEYYEQPVKNYSSGMYVRLAFSMAINIDPEILIIDEALAVGDIRFQAKCFRKLREFMQEDKTIVICTHNLNAVKEFCTRAIWFHKGEIAEQGNPTFVADCYNSFMTTGESKLIIERKNPAALPPSGKSGPDLPNNEAFTIAWSSVEKCDSFGIGGARIHRVALYNLATERQTNTLFGGEWLRIYIEVEALRKLAAPGIILLMNGRLGLPVFRINSHVYKQRIVLHHDIPTIIAVDFQLPLLGNGTYTMSVAVHDSTNEQTGELHWVHDALVVEVANPEVNFKLGAQLVLENVRIFNVSEVKDHKILSA